MSSRTKYEEILFAKERVAQVLAQTERETASLERRLAAAEEDRAGPDASALLGELDSSNGKAPDIPAISDELKRKRGVLVALQARQRALDKDLRRATIEKNDAERNDCRRETHRLMEEKEKFKRELDRVERELSLVLNREHALVQESSKLMVEFERELAQ